jgi:hypothetical protein
MGHALLVERAIGDPGIVFAAVADRVIVYPAC